MPTEDAPFLVESEGLTKTYRAGRRPAVADVRVGVCPGEILGVIGPNGAGKTTLMACLLGLLRPEAGWARLGGHASGSLQANALVGYLPERLRFDPWMTGRNFVAFHHALAGLPDGERDAAVAAVLEDVGLDPQAWSRPIKSYSRGMLQRVGLAQALVGRPRILFLDEPTSGMDPDGALHTRKRLQAFAADGGAVVVNSHQLEQLSRLCHQVVFMKEGRLEGTERLAGVAGLRWFVRWVKTEGAADRVRTVLARLDLTHAKVGEDGLEIEVADEAAAAELVTSLAQAGVPVLAAGPLKGDLEKYFRGDARDAE
jgi:ABC-2 type transport system ATP-binding protein